MNIRQEIKTNIRFYSQNVVLIIIQGFFLNYFKPILLSVYLKSDISISISLLLRYFNHFFIFKNRLYPYYITIYHYIF